MRENKDIFVFSEKKTLVRIYCEDIVFTESDGHYILVHMKDGETYRTRSTMTRLFEIVGTKEFKRTHRAFAVNLKFVHRVEKNYVCLQSGWGAVPLSRTYKEDFFDALAVFKG